MRLNLTCLGKTIRDVIPTEIRVEELGDSPGTYRIDAVMPMLAVGTVVSNVVWGTDDGTAVCSYDIPNGGYCVVPNQTVTFSVTVPHAFANLLVPFVGVPVTGETKDSFRRPNRYQLATGAACSR
jgi:hypothetical protein